MSQGLKICILSEYAYSLIAGEGSTFGGAELQMTLLAKELIKRSYDVSFVTFEKSSRIAETIEGMKVFNPFKIENSGHKYLFPQNVYKLFKILNKINADVYIMKGRAPLSSMIAFFVNIKNAVFLQLASSDKHINEYIKIKGLKDFKKLFNRFGIKYSDYIICQTYHQKNLLKQTIGKEGKVIKNLYLSPKIEYSPNTASTLKVLWVGRIVPEKRAELFLKLAKNIPDYKFVMIGGPSVANPEYYNKIKKEANKIDNIEFKGFVPHDKISKYYNESILLINTSPNEGFPNSFLEAWGYKIPVVTLGFDPDGIICKLELGFHSKDFEEFVKNTYKLLKNKNLRVKMGNNGRKYVEEEHSINHIIGQYEQIFDEIKK